MKRALIVLARANLTIGWNTFRHGTTAYKIGRILFLLFLAGGGAILFFMMWSTVGVIKNPNFTRVLDDISSRNPGRNPGAGILANATGYLDLAPGLLLSFALVLLFISGSSSVLSSLYLSRDLDTLMVSPVPIRSVFISKFFSSLLGPYTLLFFLLAPGLIGFGLGMGFGITYHLAVPLVLLLFPLIPVGLSALFVMAAVRVIPPRRIRELVGLLGAFLGAGIYLLGQLAPQAARKVDFAGSVDSLRRLDVPLLPSSWAGKALIAAGRLEWSTLLISGGLFLAVSLCVFTSCLLLAERLFYTGWASLSSEGIPIRKRAKIAHPKSGCRKQPFGFLAKLLELIPVQPRAIVYKDIRVIPRDLRNLQQFIFPVAMACLFLYRLISFGNIFGETHGGNLSKVQGDFSLIAIIMIICSMLSAWLGGTGVSREARGFWIIKVAPISTKSLLAGKIILAYLPYVILSIPLTALFMALNMVKLTGGVYILTVLFIAGLGCTGIEVGLGACSPNLNWEDPRRQVPGLIRFLTFLLTSAYLGICFVLLYGLPKVAAFIIGRDWGMGIIGWALFLLMTIFVVWITIRIGAGRLESMEVV